MPFRVLSIAGTRSFVQPDSEELQQWNDALTFGSSDDSGKAYTAQVHGMYKHRRKKYIKICCLQHESEWALKKIIQIFLSNVI
jgi:hypothetical protein